MDSDNELYSNFLFPSSFNSEFDNGFGNGFDISFTNDFECEYKSPQPPCTPIISSRFMLNDYTDDDEYHNINCYSNKSINNSMNSNISPYSTKSTSQISLQSDKENKSKKLNSTTITVIPKKRGRGRPKGSKNKKKSKFTHKKSKTTATKPKLKPKRKSKSKSRSKSLTSSSTSYHKQIKSKSNVQTSHSKIYQDGGNSMQLPNIHLLSGTPSSVTQKSYHPINITGSPVPPTPSHQRTIINISSSSEDTNNSVPPLFDRQNKFHNSYINKSSKIDPFNLSSEPVAVKNCGFSLVKGGDKKRQRDISLGGMAVNQSQSQQQQQLSSSNGNSSNSNDIHPSKRRKISHNTDGTIYSNEVNNTHDAPQKSTQCTTTTPIANRNNGNINNINGTQSGIGSSFQSKDLSDKNNNNCSDKIIGTNNINNKEHNIQMDEEEKTINNGNNDLIMNNTTKRGLFKEKLSNINIQSNDNGGNNDNVPVSDGNNNNNGNNNVSNMNDNGMLLDVGMNANNSNLDWFADENINTLNQHQHLNDTVNPFDINIFDDLNNYDMLQNNQNVDIMSDMDVLNNINNDNQLNIKQESNNNNNNSLQPTSAPISSNYVLPPSTRQHQTTNNNIGYNNNLPNFTISSSPPQTQPLFMDNNIYGTNSNDSFGFNSGLARSQSLNSNQNAIPANTIRPSNLPHLRRSASTNNNNNNNHAMQYIKSQRNPQNNININNSSHILTPFDYPLSNPAISNNNSNNNNSNTNTDSANNAYATNSSYYRQQQQQQQQQQSQQQRSYNFLWWYPEIKFCQLDNQLIPLP